MDIKELLSPQVSSSSETPPPHPTPSPLDSPSNRVMRAPQVQRKSSGLSRSFTPSSVEPEPRERETHLPPTTSLGAQHQQPLAVSSITSAPHPPANTRHYSAAAYEQVMADVTRLSTEVKNIYKQREMFEDKIEQAERNGDRDAEWQAYAGYLDWEVTGNGAFSFPIVNSLYQRATSRFADDASLWTDYVEFLIQNPNKDVPLRPVLEQATRRCPWSGDLWSHRILTLEAEGEDFKTIEDVKHSATANGMLDAGGMEELVKVYVAWCGCLRRRAFEPSATDDEVDIAEMGIRSALEHVRKIGERKYGHEYRGDPQYRLERIHIKFLTQRGELAMARDVWKALVQGHADSYDFWYRYYIWEMVVWSKFAIRTGNESDQQLQAPSDATAVLSHALQYHETMDWPEQLVQMFQYHCEQHEAIQQLRTAIIDARKISALIAKRREKENADRAAYYEQQQQQEGDPQAPQAETESSGKRKRESEAFNQQPTKKSKAEEEREQPKRDREHTVVLAKNIPLDATEGNIKSFFRDCGTILSIKLRQEGESQSASIEFKTYEDALSAQTRTLKKLKGQPIEVDFETGSILWVTNYPPAADERYIREIFQDHEHEVLEVRFPTLIKNARRRFCYVQFATAADAIKASKLDGLELDDKGQKYILQAKLSDPEKRETRHGALDEGRQIYVKNLHFRANEEDIKKYFERAGTVESVRIPHNMNGQSKGFAFVDFETAASAQAAIENFREGSIRGRPIDVELSQPRDRRTAVTIKRESGEPGAVGSPTPSSAPAAMSPNAAPAATNGTQAASEGNEDTPTTGPNVRERTLALFDIPDTVPAARIEHLLEPHGAIKKLTLRPDHGGAIVEFAEEKSVHTASLALNGTEFEGSTIRTGSVKELLMQKPIQRESRLDAKKKPETSKQGSSTNPYGHAHIRRPQDKLRSGARGRGRGGRGGVGIQSRGVGRGAVSANGAAEGVGKTNEDFRAMLLGTKADDTADGRTNGDELMEDLMGGDDEDE